MGEGRLERWSPLSGILFVALFISASAIFDDEPGPDASDGTILSYYADDGNQLKLELAFLLATFAAILFIWFVASLAGRLRATEGDRAWLHRIPPISAAAFIALLLASSATYQSVSDAADDNPDQFTIDPDLARLLNNAAYSLNPEAAIPMLAPLVLATSLVALRTRMFPRWLGWAGFVVAFGCLFGFLGVPTGLFALWVVVVSVYLIRRPEIALLPATEAESLEASVFDARDRNLHSQIPVCGKLSRSRE